MCTLKKIAVIGSESFLARNLMKYIKINYNNLYEIYCYDNYEVSNTGFPYQKIDLGLKEDIKKINFNVDVIFIFVGRTGTTNGFNEFESFINVNEVYLLNILKHYVDSESKARIIYPGSRLIFKSNEKEKINEESEIELRSIYAINKYAAEAYLNIYKTNFGVQYVVLRICTPYGSLLEDNTGNYGTFDIFTKQIKEKNKITIFGDGNIKKTYTDIKDICQAFVYLINADVIKYHTYNLGGQRLSLNDIAYTIADQSTAKIEHITWPDNAKNVDGGTVIFDSVRFDKEFSMKYHSIT